MSIRRRRSLDGAVPDLDRFAGQARRALEHYKRTLRVPCPYPKYDIGFVPRLNALAISMPGLMLVNENLLARMADPDDDFVAMVCGHEVAPAAGVLAGGQRGGRDVPAGGASTLRASVTAGPDGTIESLAVEQDQPRTHRLGSGLYQRAGAGLQRRQLISAAAASLAAATVAAG